MDEKQIAWALLIGTFFGVWWGWIAVLLAIMVVLVAVGLGEKDGQ